MVRLSPYYYALSRAFYMYGPAAPKTVCNRAAVGPRSVLPPWGGGPSVFRGLVGGENENALCGWAVVKMLEPKWPAHGDKQIVVAGPISLKYSSNPCKTFHIETTNTES